MAVGNFLSLNLRLLTHSTNHTSIHAAAQKWTSILLDAAKQEIAAEVIRQSGIIDIEATIITP